MDKINDDGRDGSLGGRRGSFQELKLETREFRQSSPPTSRYLDDRPVRIGSENGQNLMWLSRASRSSHCCRALSCCDISPDLRLSGGPFGKRNGYYRASKASPRALIGNFPTSVGVRIETWKREDRRRNMDELLGKRAENLSPAYEVKTEGLPRNPSPTEGGWPKRPQFLSSWLGAEPSTFHPQQSHRSTQIRRQRAAATMPSDAPARHYCFHLLIHHAPFS